MSQSPHVSKRVTAAPRPGRIVGSPGMRMSLSVACVLLYVAVIFVFLVHTIRRNDGVFTYTLDDPYIHLALAENLAHGHYGINSTEFSSPSSSILWPFFLVPFVGTRWHIYLPLFWNMVFCSLAAWLIGRIVSRWPWNWNSRAVWPIQFFFAVVLMLVANLGGLTFVGMEHGLQVLLAIAAAYGMVEALAGRPIPSWCLAAAVIGPMVRYENLALTVALAVALCGQRRFRAAVAVAALSLIGPGLFSVFLISLGLPALPSSVLVKSFVYANDGGPLRMAFKSLLFNIDANKNDPRWWDQVPIAVLLLGFTAREFLFFTTRESRRVRSYVLGGAAVAACLQILVGRYGWLHRYEVYALIFNSVVLCSYIMEFSRLWLPIMAGALLWIANPYYKLLKYTAPTAGQVYRQQYQMHRFVAEYYRKNVAVNDLGWVSYQRPPGVYVLDLWGLATPEAARHVDKQAPWLESIASSHKAGLAMIYPWWYGSIPDDWNPLATMCYTEHLATTSCVVFFTTPSGDRATQVSEVAAFARTLPPGVNITLGKNTVPPVK